jgi:hypothetical protein
MIALDADVDVAGSQGVVVAVDGAVCDLIAVDEVVDVDVVVVGVVLIPGEVAIVIK